MTFTVNLNEPLEQILKENNLPVGGRKRRGGAEADEKAAAKISIIGLLKRAQEIGYDAAVKGATAAGYLGAAGLVLYVADESFKQSLCNPLTLSLSRTISMLPSAAGYAATCDSAAAAYNAAITTTALLVSPLVVMALKKMASIAVSDDTVDNVGDAIVEAVRDPQGAANRAMQTRSRAKKSRPAAEPVESESEEAPIPAMVSKSRRAKGGKKTKKRVTKKRKTTRRSAFSY
jgi:hypothetical protein